VLDEIHQLPDPSRILKIAADEFPRLRLLATGSSTLAATGKFRDSLAGRKRVVHLLPVMASELESFGVADMTHRLLRGGLPAGLLAHTYEPELYAEWLDSYFARDVQELFSVTKRSAFLLLVHALLRQSGGLAELTKRELTHQPKIFGFDTGFVAWSRGWSDLRTSDCGQLWEHIVLETLQACIVSRGQRVHFWRDKQQREVDFVVPSGRGVVHGMECKWTVAGFETRGLLAFRGEHPRGRNLLVVPGETTRVRKFGELEVTITSAENLPAILDASA
jgi:predicted AAA+ superfamily ATPase